MDTSLRKTDVSQNIVKLLHGREKKANVGRLVQRHSQFTDSLVKRLGLEYELEGHQGCVNCIEWSADGRYEGEYTSMLIFSYVCKSILTNKLKEVVYSDVAQCSFEYLLNIIRLSYTLNS